MYKLLIVDDENRVREGLKKLIEWETIGFQVAGDADSAEKALEFMKINKVDVVLTDIIMFEMNGIELIGKIKEYDSSIKTIILSGYGEFDYARKALRLGAHDYLTKPVDFDELKRIFTDIKLILDEKSGKTDKVDEYLIRNATDKTTGLLVEKAKQYIQENYNENISLNTLSEILYIHPNYLSKLFKEKTGVNFVDYLTQVSIEKSKGLLRNINLKIYEVAEMTGFSNAKYFSSTFKSMVGLSPREYKDALSGSEN